MANVRDRLLALYLGCGVEKLGFLDALDAEDERWDYVVEEICTCDRPGIGLIKSVFSEEEKTYFVDLMEKHYYSVEVEAKNRTEAIQKAWELFDRGGLEPCDYENITISVEEEPE